MFDELMDVRLTRVWTDQFNSYLVLESLSVMGRFPVNMNVLALKTEPIQMRSEARNGDSL
jgi:hypothetical protein